MSTGLLIALIVAVVLVLLIAGGYAATRRRTTDWSAHVAEADAHLEEARAADKGWDRELLNREARAALEQQKPGWSYDDLHLVLVDDKPGVVEDKAHLVAAGSDGDVRVVLARDAAGSWRVDSVS